MVHKLAKLHQHQCESIKNFLKKNSTSILDVNTNLRSVGGWELLWRKLLTVLAEGSPEEVGVEIPSNKTNSKYCILNQNMSYLHIYCLQVSPMVY